MTKKTHPKIVLTRVEDIPLDRLVLAQANVRRVQHGLSIEELAEDIARRGLLQNLCVRPELDEAGEPTGRYAIPAGGRRFRALQLLVQQKRMAKNAPVPCAIRTEGLAEEDSLAENVQRVALHPLDQFRAFATLRERGLSDEDIAARFFVSVQVVRQRLKLAAASPVLLDLYVAEELTLAQLEAFCVGHDHARQEQVWAGLKDAYNKEPHLIRRLMTEGAVRADDRRAVFVGADAYEAEGGCVLRDLFAQDRGGYFQDPALLDRLALAKLEGAADAVRAEGWRWVAATLDGIWSQASGMRRIFGTVPELTPEQQAEAAALQAERDAIEAEYQDADELPAAVEQRVAEIDAALEALEDRPAFFTPEEIAHAGAFVSLDPQGRVSVERGFVRRKDEVTESATDATSTEDGNAGADDVRGRRDEEQGGGIGSEAGDPGLKPLPERLLLELTAWRTMALRDALGADPEVAQLALLHALVLAQFYRGERRSCLELEAKTVTFPQVTGLADALPARAVAVRHQNWARQLPEESGTLWDALLGFDRDSRASLLAHCVAQTVNAVDQSWTGRRSGLAHAGQLAAALRFEPAAAGWRTTAANYLGQVSKARILAAVREAKGDDAARRLENLRKADMARETEALLAGPGWLPEPLRNPAVACGAQDAALAEGQDPACAEADDGSGDPGASAYAIAAE